MATMKVTEKFELTDADKTWECEKVYMGEGTPTAEEFWKIAKEDHPGVQMVMGPETDQPGRPGQGAQRRRLPHQVCRRLPSSG
jgi:hypothetical protein